MHVNNLSIYFKLYVAGPTLAQGYINRSELNKARFLTVPLEYQTEMGKRMYRTGDWGYLLPNSVLEICGRCDTLVRIRGYGVELKVNLIDFKFFLCNFRQLNLLY